MDFPLQWGGMATNTARVFSSVHAICSPMTSVMETMCTAHQKWWWEAHTETSVKLCQGKHCGRRAGSETQVSQQQLVLGSSYTQAFICHYERLSWVHVHSHLSCWVHGVLVQYAVCMYVTLHVCLFQSVNSVPVIESYLGWYLSMAMCVVTCSCSDCISLTQACPTMSCIQLLVIILSSWACIIVPAVCMIILK